MHPPPPKETSMRNQIEIHRESMISNIGSPFDVVYYRPAAARVELVSHTENPRNLVFLLTRAYRGIYTTSPYVDLDYTADQAFYDIANTKLRTPLEMVHTVWLLNDVTRAFTHQLVRYRIGTAFIQESMRFFGAQDEYKILVTGKASDDSEYSDNFYLYRSGIEAAILSYVNQIEEGIADQDARGVLPTNILTNIFFGCSLQTLAHIMPQRLCCQAQIGEWQPILREMRRLIGVEMGEEIAQLLKAPYELGQDCGYRASFDRPCVWQKSQNENTN